MEEKKAEVQTEISREDLAKENEELKTQVQALRSDVTVLKELVVRQSLQITGLMK